MRRVSQGGYALHEWDGGALMDKLLPCPFCGGKGVVKTIGIYMEYSVKCWDCGAKIKNCDVKSEAIEAWNRRCTDG